MEQAIAQLLGLHRLTLVTMRTCHRWQMELVSADDVTVWEQRHSNLERLQRRVYDFLLNL